MYREILLLFFATSCFIPRLIRRCICFGTQASLSPRGRGESGTNISTNLKGSVQFSASSSGLRGGDGLRRAAAGSFRSYEDLSQRVGPGAADVALGWVERHVVDRLLELLAVGGELLDARLALHVPQTDRAVVTWREETESQ